MTVDQARVSAEAQIKSAEKTYEGTVRQAVASELGSKLQTIGSLFQLQGNVHVQKLNSVLEDDKLYYQKRSEQTQDQAPYAAEGAVREYLFKMGLAKTVEIDFAKDFGENSLQYLKDNGVEVNPKMEFPDFTNLEVSSHAYRRTTKAGDPTEKLTAQFELTYIPQTSQESYLTADDADGIVEMMHESDKKQIEGKQTVITRKYER